jgi:HTH-type transcriptional regulator / antitoxin HipB
MTEKTGNKGGGTPAGPELHGSPGSGEETRLRSEADLGRAIRQRRRAQRLTQEELALLADSHRNRIQEVERGKETGHLRLLLRLLNELGLELVVRPRDARRGGSS